MINPIRLCNNLFEDEKFFDADLRAFSEDHLVRLAQPENNPGSIYSTLLADTTTKYNAYYGKMSNEAVKKAIAEGATITRNNARKSVQEKIDAIQGFAKIKYGEASAEYQEMYPLGMMEYTRAHEGNVGTLFDRFVVAATARLNADYPAEVLLVTNAVTAFHSAYTARETVVSQVDILITGKNSDRLALTTQLTKNFLTIAINNIGNPDKFDDYYDPRFLPISSDSSSGITLPFERLGTLAFNVGTTQDLTGLDATTQGGIIFTFTNTGTTTMRYFGTNSATGLPGAGTAFIDVPPGSNVSHTFTELIPLLGLSETNHYLGILNIGPVGTGNFKVNIDE